MFCALFDTHSCKLDFWTIKNINCLPCVASFVYSSQNTLCIMSCYLKMSTDVTTKFGVKIPSDFSGFPVRPLSYQLYQYLWHNSPFVGIVPKLLRPTAFFTWKFNLVHVNANWRKPFLRLICHRLVGSATVEPFQKFSVYSQYYNIGMGWPFNTLQGVQTCWCLALVREFNQCKVVLIVGQ